MKVCTVFLMRWRPISLSRMVKHTGTRIFSTIFQMEMVTVFCKASQKPGMVNSTLKFFMPIHLEPKMPLAGRYFMNAMLTPAMGM